MLIIGQNDRPDVGRANSNMDILNRQIDTLPIQMPSETHRLLPTFEV